MKNIYILAAKRTPFGRFKGLLKDLDSKTLGKIALSAALKEAEVDANQVDTLILGNVIQTASGQNVARQIALSSGMSEKSTALVLNQVCGSSLKAVRVAQGLMELGDAGIVAVGGVESMTNIPFYKDRKDVKDVEVPLTDLLLKDGLIDAFSNEHMGLTAENVAEKYNVSREEQDDFAFASHQKAYAAIENNWFKDEIVPIEVDHELVTTDENVRPDTSLEKLGTLKTIFKENGTVTAGNASPLSDGAAMIILATEEKVLELGLQPIAKLGAYAEIGMDPSLMGYAPYFAIEKLLNETNTSVKDYDAFEINEAFGSQAVAVSRDLEIPKSKLNIAGGALALGHPLGATGTRLLVTLINNLKNTQQQKGIASLCIGGGMGIAYEIEMV